MINIKSRGSNEFKCQILTRIDFNLSHKLYKITLQNTSQSFDNVSEKWYTFHILATPHGPDSQRTVLFVVFTKARRHSDTHTQSHQSQPKIASLLFSKNEPFGSR